MKFTLKKNYRFFSVIDSKDIILKKETEGEVIRVEGDKCKVQIEGWFLTIDRKLIAPVPQDGQKCYGFTWLELKELCYATSANDGCYYGDKRVPSECSEKVCPFLKLKGEEN